MTPEEILERKALVEAQILEDERTSDLDTYRVVRFFKREVRRSYFADPADYALAYPEDNGN